MNTIENPASSDTVVRLSKLIVGPDRALRARMVDDVIRRNNEILGVAHRGFHFNGSFYEPGGRCVRGLQWEPALHLSLCPEMSDLHERAEETALDTVLIRTVLQSLVESCRNEQEERDALPECVVQLDEHLRRWPRQRAEAWNIQNKPGALANYERVLPKIHLYCSMHFLT